MDTYLGIDGGGSKTRALLVDAAGKKLHYAESGPSNLNAHDEDTVRTSLCEVVRQCIKAAGAPPTAACFGISGASSIEAKMKLEAMIQPLGLRKAEITTDAAIALEGAFLSGPGLLLIAGTGSVCFGKSMTGEIYRTGGWGWLADDAGSAAWIGQRALEIAIQENDGRIEGTDLRDALFTELEITSSDEIKSKLYRPTLSRSKLGELAPHVLGLAKEGDAASQSIRENALDELEKLIRTTANKLEGTVHDLALSGGLFEHNSNFREALKSRLLDFTIQEPQSSALEGSLALAHKAYTNHRACHEQAKRVDGTQWRWRSDGGEGGI